MIELTCRHCLRERVTRPRGLCWVCYYTPGVRDRYDPKNHRPENDRPLGEPTATQPGTPERMAVLEERANKGLRLYHPDDAKE
ncbi:hypothetical protein [Fimbriiglobus ruber]|uniref:hypothetical protein n=1 Tax=Fimbriiglobus ruber TaxID=1908690 RepID=UPI001EE75392|nr:hypothetical protein [Fimbriiglobus ruber]